MRADKLNVLVVEDDDFQRELIVDMVQSHGVRSVYGVENGQKALDLIHATEDLPVDIVITDLNMPEMDGLEFLRHLGGEQHKMALIIISSFGGKLLLSAGLMARMHGIKLLGVAEKPIESEQLKQLIAKYGIEDVRWRKSEQTPKFELAEILNGIRSDEFEPYFQPKVKMENGSLVGAEALARWRHPQHGIISPNAFIPQLEQSDKIDDLTFLMLDKTAQTWRLFQENGCRINVSVNLSLVSLDDIQLAGKISRIVADAGVSPEHIILEITETAAMTDVASALENLARLVMNGFMLSIDDYGTGYSSLQQLARIAFGELKVDRSFIKDISENEASRIIVESSINMAHRLHVKSVAEGVETKRDWDILGAMGCDTVQGYLIGKPMDRNAFVEFCTGYSSH